MLVLGRHCGEDGVAHLEDRSCGKLPTTNGGLKELIQ